MEPSSFALFLTGVLAAVGAIASTRNWANGWDAKVYDDHGVGVRTRWNLRVLVCSVGMTLVVTSFPMPTATAERLTLSAAVAAAWLLTAATWIASRGELWRRFVEAGGGRARIWEGTHNRLRPRELTRRGWVYSSLVVTSLLLSCLILTAEVLGPW